MNSFHSVEARRAGVESSIVGKKSRSAAAYSSGKSPDGPRGMNDRRLERRLRAARVNNWRISGSWRNGVTHLLRREVAATTSGAGVGSGEGAGGAVSGSAAAGEAMRALAEDKSGYDEFLSLVRCETRQRKRAIRQAVGRAKESCSKGTRGKTGEFGDKVADAKIQPISFCNANRVFCSRMRNRTKEQRLTSASLPLESEGANKGRWQSNPQADRRTLPISGLLSRKQDNRRSGRESGSDDLLGADEIDLIFAEEVISKRLDSSES